MTPGVEHVTTLTRTHSVLGVRVPRCRTEGIRFCPAVKGIGPSVRVVKMTEPSVRVGSAATAFNLPYNAKPPAGTPIVNSEGDLVEVFKKCFREKAMRTPENLQADLWS